MSIRSQVEKKIDNKKLEIVELEAKLREAGAFLQGLQEALKVLPKDDTANDRDADSILRPGSNMAKARDALKRAGKPMYINDLLKAMGLDLTKKNRVSVSGALGSYARKGEIFTHKGPNIFGLIEFNDQAASDEPPDNFGVDQPAEVPVIIEDDTPF
jgi:hypothetical protein